MTADDRDGDDDDLQLAGMRSVWKSMRCAIAGVAPGVQRRAAAAAGHALLCFQPRGPCTILQEEGRPLLRGRASGGERHVVGVAIAELSEHTIHHVHGMVVVGRSPAATAGFAHSSIRGILAGRAGDAQRLPVGSNDHDHTRLPHDS